jgi:hypothetical protein
VKRLLVVGDSMVYFWREYGAEKAYNVNLSFIRQLEFNLNLESGLAGLDRRYEVLGQATQLGGMTGGAATYFLTLGEAVKRRQIDEVVITVDYMSLCKELFMFTTNRTVDDLATQPQAADWLTMDGDERYKELGPLTRGFIDWVKAHPAESKAYVRFDQTGRLGFLKPDREILAWPPFTAFGVAVMRKALLRCQALARAQGATVSILLLPSRDLVEVGEAGGDDYYGHLNPAAMDRPLADMAAAIGVKCYGLTEAMRLLALPLYPLIIPGDHHYNFRGQGWLASMLARLMTGGLEIPIPNRRTR